MSNTILVAGGSGFIGTNFIKYYLEKYNYNIINIDKISPQSNKYTIHLKNSNYVFQKGSISDKNLVTSLLKSFKINKVINFAAETHVDRSIIGPEAFLQTNVIDLYSFLDTIKSYWESLDDNLKSSFRFLQVSTDEVYGSIEKGSFTEESQYNPNSPYSASKASGDHFVRAFNKTYGLPTLTTNCSNNYGPYQHEEKLIPLIIKKALNGDSLPIYGDGTNVRDWLHVRDHVRALKAVLDGGKAGTRYNIGGGDEINNLELVNLICDNLKKITGYDYKHQIKFVIDRKGHDQRYSVNYSKIESELGWRPKYNLKDILYSVISSYI